jgi:hypothetical protein
VLGSNEKLVRKSITFDGTAGKGLAGSPVPLYTVTGSVWVLVVGYCTADLTVSDGATIEVGISGVTAALIAQTTASLIDNGEIWFDNSPAAIEPQTSLGGAFVAGGADIIGTVATANVTGGTLNFACFWTPLSTDGNVVAS